MCKFGVWVYKVIVFFLDGIDVGFELVVDFNNLSFWCDIIIKNIYSDFGL